MSGIFYSIRDIAICCGHNTDIAIRQANTEVLHKARLNHPSRNRVRVPTKNIISLHNGGHRQLLSSTYMLKPIDTAKDCKYLGASLTSHKCLNRQGLNSKI